MSDDIKKLQEAMTKAQGHLQDLEGSQKQTVLELDKLKRDLTGDIGSLRTDMTNNIEKLRTDMEKLRTDMTSNLGKLRTDFAGGVDRLRSNVTLALAATSALGGTFASIEQTMTRALGDHERTETLEKDAAETKQGLADLEKRVDPLEKRAS